MHLGSHCPPGYFGMPPGSRKEASSLSPCPFWAKPITHVGLFHITTVQKCVCVPIHMQLRSTGFPGGFRVTAFQARLTTLIVSRRDGACASLRHLEERNLTSTSPKLSRSTISTTHPRPTGRFERTDRSFALYRALPGSVSGTLPPPTTTTECPLSFAWFYSYLALHPPIRPGCFPFSALFTLGPLGIPWRVIPPSTLRSHSHPSEGFPCSRRWTLQRHLGGGSLPSYTAHCGTPLGSKVNSGSLRSTFQHA